MEKEKDMRAMLVAAGPRIRQAGHAGQAPGPYSNVHVYSLLAEMLGVKPAPNNGSWGALSSVVLRK
jgi:hypothetical protein